jgi:tetratricopeptide (TPR) repeat protein
LNEALRINPNDALVHNNLGLTYVDSGKLEEAIFEFKTAIGISPDYAMAYYNLGATYRALGLLKDAIQQYATFVRLDAPENTAYVKRAKEIIIELQQRT